MTARKLPPIALSEAPPPVTIELFASYAEAKAASTDTATHAEQILAIESIDGAEQEAWVAARGREIAAMRKAIDERQKRWLKPVRELEAMIKGFDSVVFRGTPMPAAKLLESCSRHLAALMDGARRRAAAAQAALLPAATSPEEVTAALAVLQPKPSGYVEVESWTWEVTDIAKLPPEYFVLDTARLDREAAEHKAKLNVPGVAPKCEKKGHFRS